MTLQVRFLSGFDEVAVNADPLPSPELQNS